MLVFKNKADLATHLKPFWAARKSIGFVPTMGALHQGHLSLLDAAAKNNTVTVISIFVNPTQFNNPEDLVKYPRTLAADIQKIEKQNPAVVIYAPEVADLYRPNEKAAPFSFDGLEFQMEGKFRPGHFDGVGTVVKKLFEIVQPTNAYFGEKDFQQLQIVKKLVSKYKIPVNIVSCPIHREVNGLAMSSRNERLSDTERKDAALIYKTLQQVKLKFGTKSAKEVSDWVTKVFQNHQTFTLEYFEIADESTLKTCFRKSKNKKYRAFIAVFVNNIRLIDTISLN
ncbi:pantoate--beta-alanine ligase [Flavobacterium orientale]|uniref:Pantothenate synthetase n=1 Tax=Flavobacterium orientale TaxID=1756020 RepID=A0A917D9G6_9FLAO|nr:pantoate--beta-alanine ligase [Flavobacterium orientale]GGD18344.1 pantothenate synthetase [Flavobacterium orientale]